MGLIEWEFIGEGGGSSTTQTPHGGTASILPGKIEVENYDDGGSRRGYSDTDAENKGDAEMRADEGVDLVLGGTGVALGYTAAGEWLEYTVNVENDANDVSISASVSSVLKLRVSASWLMEYRSAIQLRSLKQAKIGAFMRL
jgi:hypothetical protein